VRRDRRVSAVDAVLEEDALEALEAFESLDAVETTDLWLLEARDTVEGAADDMREWPSARYWTRGRFI